MWHSAQGAFVVFMRVLLCVMNLPRAPIYVIYSVLIVRRNLQRTNENDRFKMIDCFGMSHELKQRYEYECTIALESMCKYYVTLCGVWKSSKPFHRMCRHFGSVSLYNPLEVSLSLTMLTHRATTSRTL